MTNIEQKALELVNKVCRSDFKDLGSTYRNNLLDALCRAIEQHEAFRQEVSDALEKRGFYIDDRDLGRFIIAKPDPLFDVLWALGMADDRAGIERLTKGINEELAKRGGRIVFDD